MILELRLSTVSSYFLSKTIPNTSVFFYFLFKIRMSFEREKLAVTKTLDE
jgi:hypothetical protein